METFLNEINEEKTYALVCYDSEHVNAVELYSNREEARSAMRTDYTHFMGSTGFREFKSILTCLDDDSAWIDLDDYEWRWEIVPTC